MEEENNIEVIILLNKNITLKKMHNVKMIRIKDEKYNLLIMKDYWPVLGEINGSISFDGDDAVSFENIKGFYVLSNNIFHLIIIDDDKD